MLNLSEADVIAWYSPLRPATPRASWPPTLRTIESEAGVEALLVALGALVSEVSSREEDLVPDALTESGILRGLQGVVAQFGAARMLRLAEWLAVSLAEGPEILALLAAGQSADAIAIRSSLRTLMARDVIIRMFSPERIALLRSCTDAAINDEEQP